MAEAEIPVAEPVRGDSNLDDLDRVIYRGRLRETLLLRPQTGPLVRVISAE